MPGYPNWKPILEFYSKKGYWVFQPRYRGTWESRGKFLENSPEKDIKDIIVSLEKGFIDIWNNKKYQIKNPEVYLVGSSFGGPAAILNSKQVHVKKVLALSPVIDNTKESKGEPIKKLWKIVEQGFVNGYRFDKRDWERLFQGKFYNPATEQYKVDGSKIWIIHAKDDDIVPYQPTIKFVKETGCKFTLYAHGGHGLGKKHITSPKFYKQLNKFFKST